jgi:hypothetical protein
MGTGVWIPVPIHLSDVLDDPSEFTTVSLLAVEALLRVAEEPHRPTVLDSPTFGDISAMRSFITLT